MKDEFNHELTSLVGGDSVTAAADLGRRDAERTPEPYELTNVSALVVTKLRNDEQLHTVSLEKYLDAPLTARGEATLHDPADFARYVIRLSQPSTTTLWADLRTGHIDAVLDDHADAGDEGAFAGWRQHRVGLRMQDDVDWQEWMKLNDKLVDQATFAEHLEGMTHTIVEPTAADMLEVVTQFHAKRNVTFRQAVNVTSGDVQLAYDEETKGTTGSGHIEVPKAFTIRISPWTTVDPVELTARLRWRIVEGQLRIGYSLLRPDRAKEAAFSNVMGLVIDGVGDLPLHLGAAPAAARALS